MASLASAEFSIVSGGLACIAGAALLTLLLPGFRRYAMPKHPMPALPRPGESTVPPGPGPEGTG